VVGGSVAHKKGVPIRLTIHHPVGWPAKQVYDMWKAQVSGSVAHKKFVGNWFRRRERVRPTVGGSVAHKKCVSVRQVGGPPSKFMRRGRRRLAVELVGSRAAPAYLLTSRLLCTNSYDPPTRIFFESLNYLRVSTIVCRESAKKYLYSEILNPTLRLAPTINY
jgi:hypothetical protein